MKWRLRSLACLGVEGRLCKDLANVTQGSRAHHFPSCWERTVGTGVRAIILAEYLPYVRSITFVSRLVLLRVPKGIHIFIHFGIHRIVG